jgi:hypothetical protein
MLLVLATMPSSLLIIMSDSMNVVNVPQEIPECRLCGIT